MYKLFLLVSKYRKQTIIVFCCLLLVCVVRFAFWGTEFIPQMNEGAIYIRATLPNSVNLDEAVRLTMQMKYKLMAFDEVEFVLSQTGRPNDGTDATGFFNIEFHTELKPESEWKRKINSSNKEINSSDTKINSSNKKISKEILLEEMEQALAVYPGINFAFSQPIQDNVEEYVSGVKSSLVIKIFGYDLAELEDFAEQTANAIKDIEGIEELNIFKCLGLPELQIKLEEERMARYAVSMAEAQAVIEMAIGGKAASKFYENERTFDIMVRFQKDYRDDAEKISNILIPTMQGKQVLLKEIADIKFVTGPTFIYREGSSRYIGIGFSIRGRDLGSTIEEAQQKVAATVKLNPANKMVWAGEFESQQRATSQLMLIIPVVIFLVLFLLYMNFGTVKDTLIAASAIPYGLIAGFLSLWITNTIFGISAGIGFILLFGITSINSILLIASMKRNLQKTRDLVFSINDAVKKLVRPILMVALMGAVGLLPAALSDGMGSEVQKPFAIMIVGGIIFCMILSFTVLPQVFYFAYKEEQQIG
jgi:cobalt-zinc-cadmium resistance protein CzcA